MNKKNKITKYIYITLFAILYLSVALVSGIHAVSFFSLANSPALGVMLAITFEIGQAAVLFSLLTNPNQRKKVMTWVQLSIFTLVQILGNVFSSYKYIVTNSMENLRFFREPVFVWTDLPDQTCNVIITYLVGGILPISALLLTEMLTNYLYGQDNNEITKEIENNKEGNEESIENVETSKESNKENNESDEELHGDVEGTDNVDDEIVKEETKEEIKEETKEVEEKNKEKQIIKPHFLNLN